MAAQFYSVRSPAGETVLSRGRLTTTLGVGTYRLQGPLKEKVPHPAAAPLSSTEPPASSGAPAGVARILCSVSR